MGSSTSKQETNLQDSTLADFTANSPSPPPDIAENDMKTVTDASPTALNSPDNSKNIPDASHAAPTKPDDYKSTNRSSFTSLNNPKDPNHAPDSTSTATANPDDPKTTTDSSPTPPNNPDHDSKPSQTPSNDSAPPSSIFPPLELIEAKKRTTITNFPAIGKRYFLLFLPPHSRPMPSLPSRTLTPTVSTFQRPADHVTDLLFRKLGTSGSANETGELVIKGRFRVHQIERVLRLYAADYVVCQACGNSDTTMEKGERRARRVVCEKCGERGPERSIATGYVNRVPKRRIPPVTTAGREDEANAVRENETLQDSQKTEKPDFGFYYPPS